VRDAVAYALSTLALLALMLRGTFTAWEAALLLLGYGAYLATCLLTSRGGSSGAHGLGAHGYNAVSQQHLPQQQGEQQQLNGAVVVAVPVAEVEGAPAVELLTPRAQVELVSRVGGPQPQGRKTSRAASVDHSIGGSSRPGSPSLPSYGKLVELATFQQQQQSAGPGGGMQDSEAAALVGGMAPSDEIGRASCRERV